MRFLLMCLTLALAACGNDPIADKGVAPPDNAVGDVPSSGIASPANAGAAETARAAASPPPTDDMVWQIDAKARLARFGPAHLAATAAAPLTIACPTPGMMRLVRGDAPGTGTATLSFTGNGHVASIPVTANQFAYRGEASGDALRAIVRTFGGSAPVDAAVGEASGLHLPATAVIRQFLGSCARG